MSDTLLQSRFDTLEDTQKSFDEFAVAYNAQLRDGVSNESRI